MEAYGELAAVYDQLMDDFDYPAWAAYYLSLLRRVGVVPDTLCDCACGTGSLSLEFAAAGIQVTGVDIAPDMLTVAGAKARSRGLELRLVCQDMSELRLPRPVDAIICGCDGVNYLTGDRKLMSFFNAARGAIRPGGALAFDISSAHKLKAVIGNNFFGEEREDVAWLWQNALKGDIVTMELTFFVCEADGRYRRFAETHRQRIWEADALVNMLMKCGFSCVEVFGDRNFEPPRPDELRLHLLAVRG